MFDLDAELADFAERVQRAWLQGLAISSWKRTPAQNSDVGGDVDSQHLLGLAIDVVGPYGLVEMFAHRCRREGLTVEWESDHLHVQRYPKSYGAVERAREWAASGVGGEASELSRLLNELLGGEEGQTLSARMGRRIREGSATPPERAICAMLDLMDPDHCRRAADLFNGGDEFEDCCDGCGMVLVECTCKPDPCLDEPWWLRCPDEDRDEDDDA